ncbi:MAG: MFS transporter [Acetobacteraceae bacterium]
MPREVDSRYAWFRLVVSILLSALGSVGTWSVVVALPAVQTEFGAARGGASLPYALTTIGFGLGGVLMGKLSDRFGVVTPVLFGAAAIGAGYVLASVASDLTQFALAYGLLIGTFGAASTFVPLMADISRWFERRRGVAVALCASGNYISGAFWPPVVDYLIQTIGWRAAHFWIGLFCLALMVPLALLLRAPAPVRAMNAPPLPTVFSRATNLPPGLLQALLAIAGFACCVAMSMPQVHIVAYCGDLGYGVANGARMLSLMLFGLFQGGLVPSYAIVIRENFPASEAGARVGFVMMTTLLGMAVGGWMSGAIFDLTGSYRAAFANGVGWNALNLAIAVFLLSRGRGRSLLRAA